MSSAMRQLFVYHEYVSEDDLRGWVILEATDDEQCVHVRMDPDDAFRLIQMVSGNAAEVAPYRNQDREQKRAK